MSTRTIEAITKELAPPSTWNLGAARVYRKQLRSREGMYAPIGVVGFRADIQKRIDELIKPEEKGQKEELESERDLLPPDSFPFYKFVNEFDKGQKFVTEIKELESIPDDQKNADTVNEIVALQEKLDGVQKKVNNEILKRGQDIYKWMGKYNPFSYDNYSARIRNAIDQDQRQLDRLVEKAKRQLEEATEQPTAKKRRVENLPPTFILITDARKFNYDADNMTKGEHYLKSSVQNFLNKLNQEHADRQFKIMNQIRDEVFVYTKTGTPGKYVNVYTYSRAMRLAPDTGTLVSEYYENIFPGLKVDNMGFKKWKRYATNMRKLLRRESIYGDALNDLYSTNKRTPTEKGSVKAAINKEDPIPYAPKTGDMKKGFVRETIPSGDMVGFDPTLPYEWTQVVKSVRSVKFTSLTPWSQLMREYIALDEDGLVAKDVEVGEQADIIFKKYSTKVLADDGADLPEDDVFKYDYTEKPAFLALKMELQKQFFQTGLKGTPTTVEEAIAQLNALQNIFEKVNPRGMKDFIKNDYEKAVLRTYRVIERIGQLDALKEKLSEEAATPADTEMVTSEEDTVGKMTSAEFVAAVKSPTFDGDLKALLDKSEVTESDLTNDGIIKKEGVGNELKKGCEGKLQNKDYSKQVLFYLAGLIDITDISSPIEELRDKVINRMNEYREDEDQMKKRLKQGQALHCKGIQKQIFKWEQGRKYSKDLDTKLYDFMLNKVSPDGGSLEDNAVPTNADVPAPDATERDLGPPAGSIPLQERGNKLMNGTDTPVKIIADTTDLRGLTRVAKLETFPLEDGYVTFEKDGKQYAYKSDSELTLYDPEPEANPDIVKEQPFNTLWEQGMESIGKINRGDFEITVENLHWDSNGLMFLNAHKTSAEEVSPLDDGSKMQWALFTTLMKLKFGWDWEEIQKWNAKKIRDKIMGDTANGSKIFMYAKYIYGATGTITANNAGVEKDPQTMAADELTEAEVTPTRNDFIKKLIGNLENGKIKSSGEIRKPKGFDATKWIQNHGKDMNQTFYFLSEEYWKNYGKISNKKSDFETVPKSIKELLFDKDINFAPVLKAFDLSAASGQPGAGNGARSSFLDYDSMSDQELNDLERELDEMTDLEYDSSSATSANSYNSSSDTDS